jgi:hypothetical protein
VLRRAGAPVLVTVVVVLALFWWRAPGDAPQLPAAAPSGVAHTAPGAGVVPADLTGATTPHRESARVLRDPGADPAVVLTAWDAARARAYAQGHTRALASLYLPGAVAGRRDTRLLAAYAGRGLRVRGMRMEVSRVVVLRSGARTRVLRVTDRLVGARAVRTDGTSYPLPRDRSTTRTVRLVHRDGAWRVAAVGPAR